MAHTTRENKMASTPMADVVHMTDAELEKVKTLIRLLTKIDLALGAFPENMALQNRGDWKVSNALDTLFDFADSLAEARSGISNYSYIEGRKEVVR